MADNSKAIVKSIDEHPEEWEVIPLDYGFSSFVHVPSGLRICNGNFMFLSSCSAVRATWTFWGGFRIRRALRRLVVSKCDAVLSKSGSDR